MRQELLWIPQGVDTGAFAKQCHVPYKGPLPSRVWTLYLHTDPNTPPELPYTPRHHVNAFLEDYVHDWNIRGGVFKYNSRASEGKVWLLLEFEE